MKAKEYLKRFNKKDIVNFFGYIVKADSPSFSFDNRNVDIIDVEMFLDEHCVAFGAEGIAELVAKEYKRREESYFGCVADENAKMLAVSALRECFLYDGYTMYKADTPFASAFDWLSEKYKLIEIVLDFDEETLVLALDLNNCKFDVDNYIDPNWYLYNGEIQHIIELAKEKLNS